MRTPRLEWSELKRHGLGLLPQPRRAKEGYQIKLLVKQYCKGPKFGFPPHPQLFALRSSSEQPALTQPTHVPQPTL